MPKLLATDQYNELCLGGLIMQAQHAVRNDGLTEYSLVVDHTLFPTLTPKVKLPGVRTMRRLAKEYLGCTYAERKDSRKEPFLWFHFFEVQSGISLEKRAAFLAAVCTHCTLHDR